jgi:hypothetical protein
MIGHEGLPLETHITIGAVPRIVFHVLVHMPTQVYHFLSEVLARHPETQKRRRALRPVRVSLEQVVVQLLGFEEGGFVKTSHPQTFVALGVVGRRVKRQLRTDVGTG